MKTRTLWTAVVLANGLALSAAGQAPSQNNRLAVAAMQEGDFRQAVELLTGVLASPGLTTEARAEALADRGFAYDNNGQYDYAIRDYNAVISLEPNAWPIYFRRGLVYREKGEFEQALADMDRAMTPAAHPPEGAAFLYGDRGVTQFALGHFAAAAADFAHVRAIDLTDQYAALWLSLTLSRAGNAAMPEPGKSDPQEWPAPLIALYKGNMDPAQVQAVAGQSSEATRDIQICEADFFIAEYELLKGNASAAQPILLRVEHTCSPRLGVYAGAVGELNRVGN
jgi:lipoprotein NlpI